MVNYPTYLGEEVCSRCDKLNKLTVGGDNHYVYVECDCEAVVALPKRRRIVDVLRDRRDHIREINVTMGQFTNIALNVIFPSGEPYVFDIPPDEVAEVNDFIMNEWTQ